jgi:hypothetical protein
MGALMGMLLCLNVWTAYGQPVPPTTAYTRYFLGATNAVDAQAKLGVNVPTNVPAVVALPVYRLFPDGTLVGPRGPISTAGTVTAGIMEAVRDMPIAPNSDPTNKLSYPGGGKILVAPGFYPYTGQMLFPSYTNRPFKLIIEGEGLPAFLYAGPGGTNPITTTEHNGAALYNGLNLEVKCCMWLNQNNTTNAIFSIGAGAYGLFEGNQFGCNQMVTNDAGGYTFNFELDTPRQPGVVGIHIEPTSSVWWEFKRNVFYGLACGIWYEGNRGIIEGNTFGMVGSFYTNSTYTYNTLWTNSVYKGIVPSLLGLGPAILYTPFDVEELTITGNSYLYCGMELLDYGGSSGCTVSEDNFFGGNYQVVTYNIDGLNVVVRHQGGGSTPTLHGDAAITFNGSALPWYTFGPVNDSSITSVSNSLAGATFYSPVNLSNSVSILGPVQIKSGSPGAGKVATSDASGNLTWQTPSAGGSGTVSNSAALTSGRVILGQGNGAVAVAAASGPVSIDADGSATTKGQIETLNGGRFSTNQFFLTLNAILAGDGNLGEVASGNVFSGSGGTSLTNSTGTYPVNMDVAISANGNQVNRVAGSDSLRQLGWATTMQTMQTNSTVVLLGIGDSLMSGTISDGAGTDGSGAFLGQGRFGGNLVQAYGYGGYFGLGVDTRMVFSLDATKVIQVAGSAGGAPWFNDLLRMTNNAGVITWSNSVFPGYIAANVLEVDYLKGAGASGYGTFKVQTNINNGTFTDVSGFTSVSSVGSGVGIIRITNGSIANFEIRVVDLTGTNDMLAVGFWQLQTNGVAIGAIAKGGSSLTQLMAYTNILQPLLQSWNPTLIGQWWYDDPWGFQTNLDRWNNFCTSYIASADNLMLGVYPINNNVGGTVASNNAVFALGQNQVMRSNAVNFGWSYYDTYWPAAGLDGVNGVTNAINRGLVHPSNVHPTLLASKFLANGLWQWMGLDSHGGLDWPLRQDWYAKKTNTSLYTLSVAPTLTAYDNNGNAMIFAADPAGGGAGESCLWLGVPTIGALTDATIHAKFGATWLTGTNAAAAIQMGTGTSTPYFRLTGPGGLILGNVNANTADPGAGEVAVNDKILVGSQLTDRANSQCSVFWNNANYLNFLQAFVGGKVGFGIEGSLSTNLFQVQNSSHVVLAAIDQSGNVISSNNVYSLGLAVGSYSGLTTAPLLTNVVYTNVTLNFPSTTAASFSDLLITVANLKSNDVSTINAPAIAQTNGIFSTWISNTFLFARYHNYAATAIDPASGIFNVRVEQYK